MTPDEFKLICRLASLSRIEINPGAFASWSAVDQDGTCWLFTSEPALYGVFNGEHATIQRRDRKKDYLHYQTAPFPLFPPVENWRKLKVKL